MAFKLSNAKVVNMHPAPYKQEASFTFDEDLFNNCEDNVNLYGYFQSEKWFSHIENSIRKDFEWRDDVYNMCGQMFDNITGGQAISLHIRRTDHLIKPTYHPVLPLSYYEEALSKFPSDLPVVVLSDDPEWCNAQDFFSDDRFLVNTDVPKYDHLCLEGDGTHKHSCVPYTDLCLMSLCNGAILSSSTLGWWGAWLQKGRTNPIIVPEHWYGPTLEEVNDCRDLYPEEWIVLPN